MSKKSGKTLLQVYASLVASSPEARAQAQQRLHEKYDNDPQRICYASECASKKIFFFGNSEFGETPEPNVVRADFAAWLVINQKTATPTLPAAKQWDLMRRAAGIEDETLALMGIEAGLPVLPVAGAEQGPSALMLLAGKSKSSVIRSAFDLMEPDQRIASASYIDSKGRNAAHAATHNHNTGVMSELYNHGVDIELVWRPKLGKYDPKRVAHMAVLAGNVAATTELGALAPHQFQASPACPVTPYEMGMNRINNNKAEVPRPVALNALACRAKNPLQDLPPATPADAEEQKQRAKQLDAIMKATDVAASLLGVAAPFGNAKVVEAAARALGRTDTPPRLN